MPNDECQTGDKNHTAAQGSPPPPPVDWGSPCAAPMPTSTTLMAMPRRPGVWVWAIHVMPAAMMKAEDRPCTPRAASSRPYVAARGPGLAWAVCLRKNKNDYLIDRMNTMKNY